MLTLSNLQLGLTKKQIGPAKPTVSLTALTSKIRRPKNSNQFSVKKKKNSFILQRPGDKALVNQLAIFKPCILARTAIKYHLFCGKQPMQNVCYIASFLDCYFFCFYGCNKNFIKQAR